MPKQYLKILLPVAVIAASLLLFVILKSFRPEVEKKDPELNLPKVELFTVREEPVRVTVGAQGTVRPRQQTRLTARVSGHIEWVSPDFYEGGSFTGGSILLRLDPLPYKSALAEARSRLALAEATHWQEIEAAEQARLDWQAVGNGTPSPLVLREPQLKKAEADLEAARIAVEVATENLSYTEIKAPYSGRVQSKLVDVGQAITAQVTVLGEIFSDDAMEIPLAISLDDLTLLSEGNPGNSKRPVQLSRELGGDLNIWNAYLDRTAASVNQESRMIKAFARIEPPFQSDKGNPLKAGMFVRAEIQGEQLQNAIRIPRAAIQPGDVVYRLTTDNRLQAVQIDIVRTDTNWAITTGSLQAGDQLCLTPLLFFVDGMQVEPALSLSNNTLTPVGSGP